MNIRVDTVLPPPPEPTKMVVITMTVAEARRVKDYLADYPAGNIEVGNLYRELSTSLQPYV